MKTKIIPVMFPVILIIFLCFSCKTIQYVPVPGTTKTEYRNTIGTDSIHLRDSIIIKQKNDTVFLEKYHCYYRYKTIRDSFAIRDTLRIPYPAIQVEQVNAPLTGFQHFQIWFGRAAIAFLCIILLLYILLHRIRR